MMVRVDTTAGRLRLPTRWSTLPIDVVARGGTPCSSCREAPEVSRCEHAAGCERPLARSVPAGARQVGGSRSASCVPIEVRLRRRLGAGRSHARARGRVEALVETRARDVQRVRQASGVQVMSIAASNESRPGGPQSTTSPASSASRRVARMASRATAHAPAGSSSTRGIGQVATPKVPRTTPAWETAPMAEGWVMRDVVVHPSGGWRTAR